MDLKKGIRNPKDLKKVIEIALSKQAKSEDIFEEVWALHKYKWYNWYQNLHIKKDSEADKENTILFEDLALNHPELHKLIEKNIDNEIDKLNNPIDL